MKRFSALLGSNGKESACYEGEETWVCLLGWEDPLEEGMAIHSSILARESHGQREAWWAIVHGVE